MHYFDKSGILSRGMQQVDGKPYYFSYESEPKSGWMKLEYDWYLLHPNGALQTGDFTYKDKVFSFNKDGEMIKGWITLESLVKSISRTRLKESFTSKASKYWRINRSNRKSWFLV